MLGDDPRAADQVLSRSYPVDAVEALLLCTDGLTRLVVPFGWARSYPDLLDRARRHGLEHLVERLRAVERAPDSLPRHPRLGRHDDVAAVLLVRCASNQSPRADRG